MSAQDLQSLFITESEELLQQLEQSLMSLEGDPDNDELINQLFRCAHTIKGGAGIVGLGPVVDFTHTMEAALERLRLHELAVTGPLVSALLQCKDVLDDMVSIAADGGDLAQRPAWTEAHATLSGFVGEVESKPSRMATQSAASGSGPQTWQITMKFRPDLLSTGQDPEMLLVELADLGSLVDVRAHTSAVPHLEGLDPEELYVWWSVVLQTDRPRSELDNIFLFVADDNEICIEDVSAEYRNGVHIALAEQRIGEILLDRGEISADDLHDALSKQKRVGELLVEAGAVRPEEVEAVAQLQAAARATRRQNNIRVSTDKLDKLVNLVGELVISISQVNNANRERQSQGERDAALEALDVIGRSLQEQVMTVRMVPVEELFTRFKRVVRDLAGELGKQARLEISGGQTELDKNVVEQLADPLKHLVRNCVDHGLEGPEDRKASGKEAVGTVFLRASQHGGNIVIEVSDDGRGLDRSAILATAVQRGLLQAGANPGDDELFSLLFHPGFSTKAEVTDVSGRGVGMDVVRRNVSEVRGAVTVQSEPGAGTLFRISLPLTMAIVEGMTVRVGSEILTVPLLSIVEQLRPRPEHVKTVQGKGEVVAVRDEYLPLVRLHNVFGYGTECVDPCGALVMVIEGHRTKYGLLVDEVLGQEQAVIKSLGRNFRRVDGVSGATILGDGRVSLIVDIRDLERMAFSEA